MVPQWGGRAALRPGFRTPPLVSGLWLGWLSFAGAFPGLAASIFVSSAFARPMLFICFFLTLQALLSAP